MNLYPAIDLLGGKVVRLQQGDYERRLDYEYQPAELAAKWQSEGATVLHTVDLDGARSGSPANLETIREIVASTSIPIQTGGGLRDREAVEKVLEAGAARAVVGSAAIADPAFAGSLAQDFGDRIVVAVDARGGSVAVEGWAKDSGRAVAEAVQELSALGVMRFLYTPVEADGLLEGPRTEALAEICRAAGSGVIYSGGVSSIEDLETLTSERSEELEGVIVGRALLEGRFTVGEALAALGGRPRS